MSFTNSELAQQIADLITYWSTFNQEYSNWAGGAVDGGPSSDGLYPLTDWAGVESLVPCPAKLADDVSGYVGDASGHATAAAASAAAALTSETNADASEAEALDHKGASAASAAAAVISEDNAASSAAVATAQAAAAAASAAAATAIAEGSVPSVTQAEAEAGTVTDDRLWSPQRVAQAIAALETAGVPTINEQNGDYTLVLSDGGKIILKLSGGAGETYTIPANSAVAFPLGTIIAFTNEGGDDLTIGITDDTLEGTDGLTGSRTLPNNHSASIEKITSTKWKYYSTNASGSGILSLVEDTTPQLGGDLDANGNDIDMGTNLITDTKVGQWDTAYGWGDHASGGYLTDAPSNGSEYVRKDGAWAVASGGGGGINANIGIYRVSGSHNITTSATTVAFDTEDSDPDSVYSVSSGEITVGEAGWYHVDINIPVNDDGSSGATRTRCYAWLQKDATTGTWTDVNNIRGQDYQRESNGGGSGVNCSGLVQLLEDEVIRVRIQQQLNTDTSTESGQASINIFRVA